MPTYTCEACGQPCRARRIDLGELPAAHFWAIVSVCCEDGVLTEKSTPLTEWEYNKDLEEEKAEYQTTFKD